MSISSEDFRDALRHFPSGVTIVTIRSEDVIHGLTVSAFASVSPKPPMIMIAIDHKHSAYELLEQDDAVFAVNILRQDQIDLSNRFAWLKDEDRFKAGSWTTATTGAPILEDALAWLDCSVEARYPAGTHSIYLGLVEASATPTPEAPPLVYWNRGYRHLKLHPTLSDPSET
jgi:flavin reductase (DIM6/NTAB) family NADH-FMN oxidoreductase RutF